MLDHTKSLLCHDGKSRLIYFQKKKELSSVFLTKVGNFKAKNYFKALTKNVK